MKYLLFFTAAFIFFTSCTSEYNERLNNAKKLKKELAIIFDNKSIEDKYDISKDLKNQIQIQAKISGNEEKFYSELALYDPK